MAYNLRTSRFDWVRAVKWVVVALLAVWLLQLLIAWLKGALT
jgi:hypothetical protein